MSGDARQGKKLRLTPAGSRLHFDTNHVHGGHGPTPTRPADWPVARLLQGRSVQTETVTPGLIDTAIFILIK